MDFDEAIQAHSAWKRKLAAYGARPDGSLKVAEVEADDLCGLGKWIHGEAFARWSKLAEYLELKKKHAEFHMAAGAVVRHIDAGTYKSEETALGGTSPFSKASSACVYSVMAMKRKVGG